MGARPSDNPASRPSPKLRRGGLFLVYALVRGACVCIEISTGDHHEHDYNQMP